MPCSTIGYRATELSLSLTGKMAFRGSVLYVMMYNRVLDLRLGLTCIETFRGSVLYVMLYNRTLDLRLSLTCSKAQFYKPWPIIGHRATDLSLSLTGKMAFRGLVLYIMLYNRALDLRLSLACAKGGPRWQSGNTLASHL